MKSHDFILFLLVSKELNVFVLRFAEFYISFNPLRIQSKSQQGMRFQTGFEPKLECWKAAQVAVEETGNSMLTASKEPSPSTATLCSERPDLFKDFQENPANPSCESILSLS